MSESLEALINAMSLIAFSLGMVYLIIRTHDFWQRQRASLDHIPYPPNDLPAPHPKESPEDRARGAMLGIAIGDALGLARESIPKRLAHLRWGRSLKYTKGWIRFMRLPGIISDDTQHTLLIARCLDAHGNFDEDAAQAALIQWFHMRVGPGKATEAAVAKMCRGQLDAADPTSQGNGAAMRVTPLAIVAQNRKQLDDLVERSAILTHAEPEAIEGARLMAALLCWCLDHRIDDLTPKNVLPQLKPSKASKEPGLWLMRIKQIQAALDDESQSPSQHLKTLGTSGWVYHTCASVWFMTLHFKDDWQNALLALYDVGGDTDTVGALYCACIGALCGQRIFDQEMLNATQGTHLLIHQADRLSSIHTNTPTP